MPHHSEAPRGVFVGLVTLDVIHRVDRLAGRNQKVTANRQDLAAGGPATGAAITYAALGGRARLVTALGRSTVAALIGKELADRGVEVVDVDPRSSTPVPVSAVQVDAGTGERTVTSVDDSTHALDLGGRSLQGVRRAVEDADVVLVDGHHRALAVAAARHVTDRRTAELGAPSLLLDAGRWRPVMAELLPLVDVAICSADFRTPGAQDTDTTVEHLRHAGPAVVVTTDGPRPVRWWEAVSSGQVDVPDVPARDTLGAGDAFHGAYAWTVANGRDTQDAVRVAVRIASLRVGVVGPRAWMDELPPLAPDLGSVVCR